MRQEFKDLLASMVVLFTCKNEEDPFKNEGTRVVTTFLPYKPIGIFPDTQGQLTSLHHQKSNLVEITAHTSFCGCPDFMQE